LLVSRPSRSIVGLRFLYGTTIFSSAFLLFEVQPMIAKLILPWFGGAVAVWCVCMLFFQGMLLMGYLYAHLLTKKFHPSAQGWIHTALLGASLLLLPTLPPSALKPSGAEDPAIRVLLVLAITIGLPYLLLSSTSPLLQAWHSKSGASSGSYRFYALSNTGSLLALLSYPLVVEPALSSHHQAISWSVAYAVVAVLCAAVAIAGRFADSRPHVPHSGIAPDWQLKVLWVALAACGSAVLLSVTNYISQNIAAVPLLWIIPLSVYLLTFIICFEGHDWYRRGVFLRLLAVALAGMAYALAPGRINLPPYILIPLFCGGLFACCIVCHGELSLLKPHPAHLTSFYLLVSLGGTLGALFVALLAPRIFSGYYELPISLGFCGVLIHIVLYRDRKVIVPRAQLFKRIFLLGSALVVALCASLYMTARRHSEQSLVTMRNFYGVLRVEDRAAAGVVLLQGDTRRLMDPDSRYRDLINGTIEHGIQFLSTDRHRETTTYYGPNSGVGLALRGAERAGLVKVGIIGLGTGTIAAYGRPGDQYTFYEINPAVIALANSQFSFLRDSLARVNVLTGDARLSLEQQAPQQFDVLAVDAFSSDAIPIHLLTREALALYLRHVTPTGVIAVHVSNKYLNLAPIVTASATALNRKAVVIESGADVSHAIYQATWVLVGNESGVLQEPELRAAGKPVTASNQSLWTDDYSSILKAFK